MLTDNDENLHNYIFFDALQHHKLSFLINDLKFKYLAFFGGFSENLTLKIFWVRHVEARVKNGFTRASSKIFGLLVYKILWRYTSKYIIKAYLGVK